MFTSIARKDIVAARQPAALAAEQREWVKVCRRYLRRRLNLLAVLLLATLCLVALLAPWVAPFDPAEQLRDAGHAGQPLGPDARFWLGTDNLQRDLLSRLIYGARVTLSVGLAAGVLTVVTGLAYGSIAGLAGGALDNWLMRVVDIVISLPTLLIMMLLLVILGRSVWVIVGVIVLVNWAYPARIFHAEVISLKEREYILAARNVGAGSGRILLRHILPHLLPLGIIYIGLSVPVAIFAEASLSFLGLGIPPPTPDWGSMLQEGLSFYRSAPRLVLLPGVCIMLTVIAFNLFTSGLRDALDPLMKETR